MQFKWLRKNINHRCRCEPARFKSCATEIVNVVPSSLSSYPQGSRSRNYQNVLPHNTVTLRSVTPSNSKWWCHNFYRDGEFAYKYTKKRKAEDMLAFMKEYGIISILSPKIILKWFVLCMSLANLLFHKLSKCSIKEIMNLGYIRMWNFYWLILLGE